MNKPSVNMSGFTTKRALIDKANTTTVAAAAVAAFLLFFTLVAGKALLAQIGYQNNVISGKKETLQRLKDNKEARDILVKSYDAFVSTPQNTIGGNTAGTGERDGDNAKIILDALPSKYDFPALTSSLEKFAASQNVSIESIAGTDDEVAQSGQMASTTPKASPLVFQIKVKGPYLQLQEFTKSLEKSIRPIKMQKISVMATEEGVSLDVTAETYYQPEKSLELKKEVLKP